MSNHQHYFIYDEDFEGDGRTVTSLRSQVIGHLADTAVTEEE